ncbi:MAG: hypothetical protein CVT49_14790 [candidate division Zixibacteria bacterium HGW-Zixibacteria-1]|nr:MAG: hypothetical protein CVT49_14790 [candidate division Zixibacteria bacterium HGW-Zixibacteria-1]
MKTRIIIIAVLILAVAISCRTRLKPILFELDGENRVTLNQKETWYQVGYDLYNTATGNPLVKGDGIILVSSQYARHPERNEIQTGLFKSAGEIEYRLFIPLLFINEGDSLDIGGKSVCRLIGLYEMADSLKHYDCRQGYLKIDTVKSSRFSAYMSGKYFNSENDSLVLEGRLNAVKKK